MKKFVQENKFFTILLICIVLLSLAVFNRIYLTKRPWLAEAEMRVIKDFPVGTSRARIFKIAHAKNYYIREADDNIIRIHVFAANLKNRPQGWYESFYDAAVIDVYLDSSDKATGYSSAYGVRVVMP